MNVAQKNHYVPIWYQKRFLTSDRYFYFDLHPNIKELSDGRIISTTKSLYYREPGFCFKQDDLYTTSIFGMPNDEIERLLFGTIDSFGPKALTALIGHDLNKLHDLFNKFFEYLDAQKLRTPKGLDWVRSNYHGLSQNELMHEMQRLRQIHCTMWVEGVREIVSAEDSSFKFIISDHPVTIYNHACPPKSPQCKYPNDPAIALKASQTIFPLDLNHCLILTNLEYARDPKREDPLTTRTFARYSGETIVRWDTMIRSRRLRESEVLAINYVVKSRARRFIAAAEKDWLYPEKFIKSPWSGLGKVLLPPKNELWNFGGEILIGGKDGQVHYQDAFGRSLGEITYLKKEPIAGKIGRNDPCRCGSGKKYKKCCFGKPPSQSPSSTEYSIRERNIILYRAITDILSLSKGKTWEDIRREISEEQVIEIHKLVGALWPRETSLMNLLPRPDSKTLRALYVGIVDPRVILRNVIGFTLYFDEIIIQSPFINPACFKEEFNPIYSPSQFKADTIKSVLLLLQLAPFIEAGLVHMIPDPCDFDFELRKATMNMAKERIKNWVPSGKDSETMKLYTDDHMRNLWRLPEKSLKRKIRKDLPQISDDEIEELLEHIEEMKIQDPLSLLQPLEPKTIERFLLLPNLELGLFLSQITGSFIYTDNQYRWGEILGATINSGALVQSGWDLVAKSFSNLPFTFFNLEPLTALTIRQSGKLGDLRKLLRRIWINVQANLGAERVDGRAQGFIKELREVHSRTQTEWQLIQKELRLQTENIYRLDLALLNGRFECRIPITGFGLNSVNRLLLAHSGRTDYLRNLPMAVFLNFSQN